MFNNLILILGNIQKDRTGATSIEYAIMAAGIAVAIVATVGELGDPVDGLLGQVKTAWDATFGG